MQHDEVSIGSAGLGGDLLLPWQARGLVVFAHGSGSSRRSARDAFVCGSLHRRALATLRFDLLAEDEATRRAKVFDIALLCDRLLQAIDWCGTRSDLARMPLGLFGASTGAAAALAAAADRPLVVHAVVSRGGRPDLAMPSLARVRAPTLLVVGADDTEVLALNRRAFQELRCEKRLAVVPGATHLFEERGTLRQVAELAGDWFERRLAGGSDASHPPRPE